MPYFILSANGNNVALRQQVDREILNDGWMPVPSQVHGDTTYWLVLPGSYQIRKGNGPASNLGITANQTGTLS